MRVRGVFFGCLLGLFAGLAQVALASQFVFLNQAPKSSSSCAQSAAAIAALKAIQVEKPKEIDLLVIGAGPAGLSLGYFLKSEGLKFVILEKGANAGDSFSRMPPGQLMNPGIQVRLPGRLPKDDLQYFSRVSFHQYGAYLQNYAEYHQLPVRAQARVYRVTRQEDGRFLVESSQGIWLTRQLVNASGYFSQPIVPLLGRSMDAPPYVHSSLWPGITEVQRITGKEKPRVLVVGGGVSSGEILREVVEAGWSVHLSTRSSPQVDSGKYGLSFYVSPIVENLLLHSGLAILAERRALGLQGQDLGRWIEVGVIQTRPGFRGFSTSGQVEFQDASLESYDFVVFATGFRPALRYFQNLFVDSRTGLPGLRDEFESDEWENLYFLGLQEQSSAFSQYIMGIKYDAQKLARRLVRGAQ